MSGIFARAADFLENGRPSAPVCRFHGVHCQMGRNWPLDRAAVDPAGVQMDDLLDLVHQGRREAGLPVDLHPRERWAINRHELVPPAELAAEKADIDQLIADLKAKNAAVLAELTADNELGAEYGA